MTSSHQLKHDTMFRGVQALRFFAALLVVATHGSLTINERIVGLGPGRYWAGGLMGVDIFFVISGFVMAVTSDSLTAVPRGWIVFAKRRIERVVPLYWIATTLKIAAVAMVPSLALHSHLHPFHVLTSYLFLPGSNSEGDVLPVLTQGWTLVFEMFFYMLFALSLFVRLSPLVLCGSVFAILALIGMVDHPTEPALSVYTRPIIFEFVFGMLIAKALPHGRLPPSVAGLLLLSGLAGLMQGTVTDQWRLIAFGIPAASIVLGVVHLEPTIRRRIPGWMLEQGDASYSLYLFHTLLIPVVVTALLRAHMADPTAALVICCGASVAVGLAIHRLVERPLNRLLRRRRPTAAPGALSRVGSQTTSRFGECAESL